MIENEGVRMIENEGVRIIEKRSENDREEEGKEVVTVHVV